MIEILTKATETLHKLEQNVMARFVSKENYAINMEHCLDHTKH